MGAERMMTDGGFWLTDGMLRQQRATVAELFIRCEEVIARAEMAIERSRRLRAENAAIRAAVPPMKGLPSR